MEALQMLEEYICSVSSNSYSHQTNVNVKDDTNINSLSVEKGGEFIWNV